ncbi:MAG: hypothetical protein WBW08_07695 [Methyloceanibacter sp.]
MRIPGIAAVVVAPIIRVGIDGLDERRRGGDRKDAARSRLSNLWQAHASDGAGHGDLPLTSSPPSHRPTY